MTRAATGAAAVLMAVLAFGQPASAEPPTPPVLGGTWAMGQVAAGSSKIPVYGTIDSRTVSWSLVEVDQTGDRLDMKVETCGIELRSDIKKVRTILPEALVGSIGVYRRQAILRWDDGTWHFVQPRHYSLLGMRLEDRNTDDLPDEADDPRVYDQDGDGEPGVTIVITGLLDASLYVVQRTSDALRGRVLGSDRIAGHLEWHTEQEVLDSTSFLVGDAPATTPSARDSTFEMRRLPENATCRDVLGRRDALTGE